MEKRFDTSDILQAYMKEKFPDCTDPGEAHEALCESIYYGEFIGNHSFETVLSLVFPMEGSYWRMEYEINEGAGYNDLFGELPPREVYTLVDGQLTYNPGMEEIKSFTCTKVRPVRVVTTKWVVCVERVKATILEYNTRKGVAVTYSEEYGKLDLSATAFFSGPPNRLPRAGDSIMATVEEMYGTFHMTYARLVPPPNEKEVDYDVTKDTPWGTHLLKCLRFDVKSYMRTRVPRKNKDELSRYARPVSVRHIRELIQAIRVLEAVAKARNK